MGGGGKGGTTVQSTQIPPEVLARYNAVNAKAESVAATPFQSYGGEFVAPINQTQQAGINATSAGSQLAQPYYGAATGATLGSMQNVGPLTQGQIGYYQNPYTQAVVNPTIQALQQQQGQQLAQQQGQAIMGGAFGGDRANLARAQLQGQQNLALGQAIAPLYQQGYGQAVQTAMGQQGVVASDLARQMAGGMQLGNLGAAAQQAALSGAQAQIAAGTLPQQTQQALDTAQYNQFLQERGYPFQTTQFLANIAEGTGALSGNTTTQNQSGGFFASDERLKKNIEHVGKLNDGQNIYRYQYKDDPHENTHIGVLGQEALAKHKPGIGLDPDGYLAVNYHDVTDDAAHHGKGLVPNSMGGAVHSSGAFARGGYALGGEPDFGGLVAAHGSIYDAMKSKDKASGLGIPNQPSGAKLSPTPMLQRKQGQDPLTTAANFNKNIVGGKESLEKMASWRPFGGKGTGDKLQQRAPSEGASGQKTVGLGGNNEPWKPDSTNSVKAEYSGTAYPANSGADSKPAWYNPSSDGNTGIRVADSGQTMNDASVVDAPEMDTTNWQDLGSVADDALSSTGDLSNFGDFFAYGGLVPRQHHAMGKPVMPGMDTSDDPIGDVVSSGEQDTKSLQSEQHGVNDQRMSSSGGGGGGGLGSALSSIAEIGSWFLKDGGRVGYAEGGGSRLSYDALQDYLQSTSSRPNEVPLHYDLDDGTQLRGSGLFSGPYSQYGVGLGTGLGGGRLEANASRGSAPHSPAQYRGGLSWSKNFAYGGLVPREHHDGTRGNVAGGDGTTTISQDNVPAGPSDQDLDYMTRVMLSEARGEGDTGMAAVGHVINNRAKTGKYKNISEVVTTPDQFAAPMDIDRESDQYRRARDIASGVLSGNIEDPTGGATHFANVEKVRQDRGSLQPWLQNMVDSGNTTQIGNHTFGKADGLPAPSRTEREAAPEPGLGGFMRGRSGPGKFNGVPSRSAGLGDVFSEYAPEGMPTSENFWIPAASFLGGMLTSPNRSFLGALGSGLVSGASSQMELDKLNEERAKSVMNYVKENFTTGVHDGKPAVFDQFGTPYASTLDAQAAVAQLFLSRGLNPENYGIPKAAVDAAKAKISGKVIPPQLQQEAGKGQPKQTVDATIPPPPKPTGAEQPAATPKIMNQEDLLAMEPRQLEEYVQSTPQLRRQYGLEELDTLDRRATENRQIANNLAGNPKTAAQAQEYSKRADEAIARRKELLEKATAQQKAVNANYAVGTSKRVLEDAEDRGNRNQSRMETREATDRLAEILSRYETSGPKAAIQPFRAWAGELGIPYDKLKDADFAEINKIVQDWTYKKMDDQKLTRAPASSQSGLAKTVPGANVPGPASKMLLARAKAYMDMAEERDMEYAHGTDPKTGRANYGTNPDRFADKWFANPQNQEKLKAKIGSYLSTMPDPKGITREQKEAWKKEFGDYYDPAAALQTSAPPANQPAPVRSGRTPFNQPFKVIGE